MSSKVEHQRNRYPRMRYSFDPCWALEMYKDFYIFLARYYKEMGA